MVFGETIQENSAGLREVFEKLRQFNFKIEPDKCEFLKTELIPLGHVVASEGVRPDPEKIKAITDFPTSKNTTDIKSFLGLAGYYRKFTPQFSKCAKPLNDLLKKNQKCQWGAKQVENFRLLHAAHTHEPVLQYPHFRCTSDARKSCKMTRTTMRIGHVVVE
jgi:hypothetical protein